VTTALSDHSRLRRKQKRDLDVWESEETFQRFGELIGPILLQEVGMPGQPQLPPIHNFVK
jgi:hypothetical protein